MIHLIISLLACSGDAPENNDPVDTGCDNTADGDADGLFDCDELDLYGTDPDVADSDGDGLTDGAEIDCVSDPNDSTQVCFTCGWGHNDPGDLVHSGDEEGDTIANVSFVDQCGDEVEMWDFAGEYHILYMTATW